jgi:integrase
MLTKAVKLPKEPPGRLRYLELEEIERLLDACDDPQNYLKKKYPRGDLNSRHRD